MFESARAAALRCGSGHCMMQMLHRCPVHRHHLLLRSQHSCRRLLHAAPHHSTVSLRRASIQAGHITVVRCASPAAEQPEHQPGDEPTKRCLRCGDTRTLSYFPLRTSQPDGHWIHCFACQHELWLQAKPPRRLDDNENPPTQKPQVCKKCHSQLPARWFRLHPKMRSGRRSACFACLAKQRRGYAHIERTTPQQKECPQCRRTLAAADFSFAKGASDGLQWVCKDCRNANGKNFKRPLVQVEVSESAAASADKSSPRPTSLQCGKLQTASPTDARNAAFARLYNAGGASNSSSGNGKPLRTAQHSAADS